MGKVYKSKRLRKCGIYSVSNQSERTKLLKRNISKCSHYRSLALERKIFNALTNISANFISFKNNDNKKITIKLFLHQYIILSYLQSSLILLCSVLFFMSLLQKIEATRDFERKLSKNKLHWIPATFNDQTTMTNLKTACNNVHNTLFSLAKPMRW